MPKTTFFRLNESTLRNALRVAAETYEGHAKEFRALAEQLRTNPPPPPVDDGGKTFDIMPRDPVPMDRMAEQFDHQAKDVRDMMDRLDGPEGDEDDYMGGVEVRVIYTPDED